MRAQPTRRGSITFLLVVLILTVVVGVVAFLPLVLCRTRYCYEGYREAVRCLNVASSGPYPESVRQMYDEQVRNWRCDHCTAAGRATLLQRMGGWLPWEKPPTSYR